MDALTGVCLLSVTLGLEGGDEECVGCAGDDDIAMLFDELPRLLECLQWNPRERFE